jgi:hypothetical protein
MSEQDKGLGASRSQPCADAQERSPIDSKSWDGITIGLIDAVQSILAVLNERIAREAKRLKRRPDDEWAWFSPDVQEALTDLRHCEAAQTLLYHGDAEAMDIIRRAADALRRPTDGGEAVQLGNSGMTQKDSSHDQ